MRPQSRSPRGPLECCRRRLFGTILASLGGAAGGVSAASSFVASRGSPPGMDIRWPSSNSPASLSLLQVLDQREAPPRYELNQTNYRGGLRPIVVFARLWHFSCSFRSSISFFDASCSRRLRSWMLTSAALN